MDSPFFALFFWTVIGTVYLLFFRALYLAVTLKVETGQKVLLCLGIIIVQPFAWLLFLGWYLGKYKTLKRV